MQVITTKDQSFTLFSDLYQEHYHSVNGAVSESNHIYIDAGLRSLNHRNIRIFEMGLGTGLNAYLTAVYAENQGIEVEYVAVEKHPLEVDDFLQTVPKMERHELFTRIHQSDWGNKVQINKQMSLLKEVCDMTEYQHQNQYHLVYYDAFSPDTQPELWTKEIFKSLYDAMFKGGVLVTYSVKGDVKRALKAAGFSIEKLPGPAGKREILRARKV